MVAALGLACGSVYSPKLQNAIHWGMNVSMVNASPSQLLLLSG
jgi:hypothetical protein